MRTEPPSATTRAGEVDDLLRGAVDLHCHTGPSAFPRSLNHYEAMTEADDAGFRALVYKDHFYLGTVQADLLSILYPERRLKLFSGIVLNNTVGGINPHAVAHAITMGAKIVWMPTFSAGNHVVQTRKDSQGFPSSGGILPAMPLSPLDPAGDVTDEAKRVLDLVAKADIILASGHLHVSELHVLFDEARRRGVRKMLVNHPTFIVGCSDEDMRQLAGQGVYMEHDICMFIEEADKIHELGDLRRFIELVGIDRTCICSDLGLAGIVRPVDGFRIMVRGLIDLGFEPDEIRALVGGNSAMLLGLVESPGVS